VACAERIARLDLEVVEVEEGRLQAAAEGGFVDAIMLQYAPWLEKDSPLNKALDSANISGCRKCSAMINQTLTDR